MNTATMATKKCGQCQEVKSHSDFHISNTRADGLAGYCKPCRGVNGSEYYNRPEIKSKSLAWQKNHRQTPDGKYASYKGHSRNKRRDLFSLSKDEFMLFWQKPCFYCDEKIEAIGLDRVDSSKGYFLGNVVSCCRVCNQAKSDRTQQEFINKCRKVVEKDDRRKALKSL